MNLIVEDVAKCCLHINKIFNRVWIESSLSCCLFINIKTTIKNIIHNLIHIDFTVFCLKMSIQIGNVTCKQTRKKSI